MNVVDVFSGIGGMALGLQRAGMHIAAFCEIDEFCQSVLMKHWPRTPIFTDIRFLNRETLHVAGIESVDVVAGGFPCQDISKYNVHATRQGTDGDRSGLWSEMVRLVSEVRPRYVIVENVTAILSGNNGEWFGRVLGDLATIGYDAEWHCIPAARLGAIHLRDRMWLIAHPHRERLEGVGADDDPQVWQGSIQRQIGLYVRDKEQDIKPPVPFVDDGIPDRVARLTAIGNAVYPPVAEVLGRAIMEDAHAIA